MNLRCSDVFIKRFFFPSVSYLFPFVMAFISRNVKQSYQRPSLHSHVESASSCSLWSCRHWGGKYERSPGCPGQFRLPRCSPLSHWDAVYPSLITSSVSSPGGDCAPRLWRLAKQCPSLPLSFPTQPLLSDFDTSETISVFMCFFNGTYVCIKVFCF